MVLRFSSAARFEPGRLTINIDRHIWDDKQDGGELYQMLRIAGKKRKRKKRGSKDWREKNPNRIDIDQRPSLVEQKKRARDWEADLVSVARHKGFLVTLVERKYKYTLIGHVAHKTSLVVQDEIIRLLGPMKSRVYMITFDNGMNFIMHRLNSRPRKTLDYKSPNELHLELETKTMRMIRFTLKGAR